MQSWHNIVQTAQLGTEKRQAAVFPEPSLAEAVSTVQDHPGADREEKFLQSAALAFNFRQCGSAPATFTGEALRPSPVEDLEYAGPAAHQALKDIFIFESAGLLKLWLQKAAERKKVARPEMLPVLLDMARQQRALRPMIEPVLGHRGKWLSQFNPDWQFTSGLPDDELWHTGSPQQRKQVLLRASVSDPGKALQWLKDTWGKENAAARTDLLKDLPPSLFEPDLPWLEALLDEKSVKVKEEALKLLKLIPSSAVVRQYWEVLKSAVSVVTEKTMLGLSSKKTLKITAPASFDDSLFKTGIERTTTVDRSFLSEGEMILYQLAEHIPPVFWEAHFQDTPGNIYELFAKDKTGNKFLPSMGMAVYRFGNAAWAPLFTADGERYFQELLPLLEPGLRERYMVRHFDVMTEGMVRYLTEQQQEEWGMNITRVFMQYAAGSYYHYNRGFWGKFIHLVPVQIAAELDKFTPAEEYAKKGWTEMGAHLLQLLSIKSQTLQAFHQ